MNSFEFSLSSPSCSSLQLQLQQLLASCHHAAISSGPLLRYFNDDFHNIRHPFPTILRKITD